MLRKNAAGQHVFFGLINATTGAALPGVAVAAKVSLDTAAQATASGSVTETGGGQYRFDPSQADTNGDFVGYLFTATNAIPVSANFITTGGDFRQVANFGLTDLDATVSSRLASTSYVVPPTSGAIATQIWTDLVAGTDFATAGSIGKLLSTGGVVIVGGYSTGQDPATLVLDILASLHNAPNTIGSKLNAAGAAADPLANPVPGSYASGSAGAVLGGLSGMNVTVVSPLSSTGQLTLVQGDDYKAADNRAIAFINASGNWPNLTGATVTLNAWKGSAQPYSSVGPIAGNVVVASGANQKVQFELPAAQTSLLAVSVGQYDQYAYAVLANLANGDVITLQLGNLLVLQS